MLGCCQRGRHWEKPAAGQRQEHQSWGQTLGFHLSSALPFLQPFVTYGGHTTVFLSVKWRNHADLIDGWEVLTIKSLVLRRLMFARHVLGRSGWWFVFSKDPGTTQPGTSLPLGMLSRFQGTGLQAAGKRCVWLMGCWALLGNRIRLMRFFNNSSLPIWGKSVLGEI